MQTSKMDFLDIIYRIVKWRKLLIINLIIIMLLSAAFSLIIPVWYTSKATILSPKEEGGLGLSSFLSDLNVGGLISSDISEEANLFLAILKSRNLLEKVAIKFNLQERYQTGDIESTIAILAKRINVIVNEEGTLTITIDVKTKFLPSKEEKNSTKLLSKEICDYVLLQLDETHKSIKTSKAKNTRIFIEKRYNENLASLKDAEDKLKQYQQEHSVIAVPEQTQATIEVISELKAQIIAKEIELGVLLNYTDRTHNEVKKLDYEIKELKNKLTMLKSGSEKSSDKEQLLLPLNDLPDLGLNYLRLYREVKIQEKIMEFILPQFEQAKLQEAKDSPTVQILDEAKVPLKKSKPRRSIFVIVCMMSYLLVFFVIALFYEYLVNYNTNNSYKIKLDKILREIKRPHHN